MSAVENHQAVAAAQAAVDTAKNDYEALLPHFTNAFNKANKDADAADAADAAANEAAIRRQLGLVNEAVNAATQKLLLTSQQAFQYEQKRIATLEAEIAEHRNAAAAFESIISRIGWENM